MPLPVGIGDLHLLSKYEPLLEDFTAMSNIYKHGDMYSWYFGSTPHKYGCEQFYSN